MTVAVIILSIALLMSVVINYSMCMSNRKKIRAITTNSSLGKLDEVLVTYYKKIDEINSSLLSRQQKVERIEDMFEVCTQKVGCVRYNAFEDVGSDLSFSIALLNAKDDGIVITSIFGRNSTNMYVKPVINSTSDIPLSNEELEAIEQAKSAHAESVSRKIRSPKQKMDRQKMKEKIAYDKAVNKAYEVSGEIRRETNGDYGNFDEPEEKDAMTPEKRESIAQFLSKK